MQKTHRYFVLAGTVALAASLAACGHNRPAPAPQYSGSYGGGYQTAPAYPQNAAGTEYGRVSNIEVLQGRGQGQTTGAGAVVGAVIGGVLGNQVGKGSGRAAATAVGVVGGAVAGHMAQNSMGGGSVRDVYRVSVQLQDGSVRAFDYPNAPDFRPGDYVRVDGNQIYR